MYQFFKLQESAFCTSYVVRPNIKSLGKRASLHFTARFNRPVSTPYVHDRA